MAGVCLCRYEKCSKRFTCLRFTTQENEMSSFADFQYICNNDNNYTYYWEVKDNEITIVED